MQRFRIAVDVGGTFTDLVCTDREREETINIKVPSTPGEPAEAIGTALQGFLKARGDVPVSVIIHATTLASNALLGQQALPKTALITTEGFRDILEIGRQRRDELYNLFVEKPRPLVPRRLRFSIRERVGPKGQVLTPLDRDQAGAVIARLEDEDIESIAISLLFSHINSEHENEIRRILKERLPNAYVSLSSVVAPEPREYERTSTTVVDAILKPLISEYLCGLHKKMRDLGIQRAPLCIMQSDGGIATRDVMTSRPVGMIESGPAAGVIASAFHGKLLGIDNLLSFDMGGTTAKAGAIRATTPQTVDEYEVAGKIHSGRIVKGSGYPIIFPFIDLAECSAGGGTTAWLDDGGALRVGPISAGADPGPACYGKGGKEPTVTDANLVLGRLNPRHLLDGKMEIWSNLSEQAIMRIGRKIHLSLVEVAAGIVRITNSAMAKILRIVSIERGYDPRDFAMMCFGGAGPMHGCALAGELKIKKIVVPRNPGLFSAFGLLTSDFRYPLSKTIMGQIEKTKPERLERTYQKLEAAGCKMLERQHVSRRNAEFVRQLEMRYVGQSYELAIVTSSPVTRESLGQAVESFHRKHEAKYGYAVPGEPVEIVNVKLQAIGRTEKPKLQRRSLRQKRPLSVALRCEREVYFEEDGDWTKTPVYIRDRLNAGHRICGPAVIEQYDATTVVYPKWTAVVDGYENIVISKE